MSDAANQIRKAMVRDVPDYDVVRWHGRRSSACVLIPVINEGHRIGRLLARMHAIDVAGQADIIIVDGGSTDGSLAADLLDAANVAGLLVKRGPGKLSAQLRCAYDFALREGYDEIVTIDGNDKDDPDPIFQFIAAIRDGVDFVQASRFVPGGIEENTPAKRRFAVRYIHAPLLSIASGFHWTDTTQGFRAYSRRMLTDERVGIFRGAFRTYELLAYLNYRAPRLGYRCIEIPTARRYPADEAVPTKIDLAGEVGLLVTLVRTCLGGFDPVPDDAPIAAVTPPAGWISPGEALYADVTKLLLVLGAIAMVLLVSFHVPLHEPLTDLFQEGEYLSTRLYFAADAGRPLLIHGQIDYMPARIATTLCTPDTAIVCTRAVNSGLSALAGILFFFCALFAVDRGRGGRYYAAIAALILIVMVNGQRLTNIGLQQGSPAIRDVSLLATLVLLLLGARAAAGRGRWLVFAGGLVAGLSVFFAYNRGITGLVAIIAYAGVAALLTRDGLRGLAAAAGMVLGVAAIVLADPAMAQQHVANILYWARHADLWHTPANVTFWAHVIVFYLPVALMLGVTAWVGIWAWRSEARRAALPLLTFLAVCCVMITQQSIGRDDLIHLSFALPWIFLLGVYLTNWLPPAARGLDRRDILLTCGLFGLVFTDLARERGAIWEMISGSAVNLYILTHPIPKDATLIGEDVQRVVQRLRRDDDRCIYAANNGAALYHLVDRPPCSTVMAPTYATLDNQGVVIADLRRTRPRTIIWESPDWFSSIDGRSIQSQTPALAAWIETQYPHVSRIGSITLRSRMPAGEGDDQR